MRTVHYIGFRGDEYWSAFRIWGGPRMIHRVWDARAKRDIDPDHDIVIFATGDETQPVARHNGNDLDEGKLLPYPAWYLDMQAKVEQSGVLKIGDSRAKTARKTRA